MTVVLLMHPATFLIEVGSCFLDKMIQKSRANQFPFWKCARCPNLPCNIESICLTKSFFSDGGGVVTPPYNKVAP